MTNLRDEVRGKVGIAVGHGSLCWEPRPIGVFDSTEASKAVDTATTEILQAIVGALPDKGNIQRYSKGSMGETLMLLSDGYDKCLADIKKLLGVKE